MPTPLVPERVRLDVHCALDDSLALCGGNKAPRVRLDQFVHLGALLASSDRLRGAPWQRCPACVAVVEGHRH